jgi:hypothetical protein
MNNTPYETLEQQALFDWAKISGIPDIDLLHAIPNGGHRNKATAGRLKAEGVKRGVPDICLPVPRGVYASLYIELKRKSGGAVTPEQAAWIGKLNKLGHYACVAKGWLDAKQIIEKYLRLKVGERIEQI